MVVLVALAVLAVLAVLVVVVVLSTKSLKMWKFEEKSVKNPQKCLFCGHLQFWIMLVTFTTNAST